MLERLPTPWGLVRLGVAPDHPKIKAVSRAFEKIARAPGLPLLRQRRGRPRPHARRARCASTTRWSTPSARRPTGGSGSPARTCPGSWAATEFVAWYNGHPDFQDLEFDLGVERAVVIGNGNVAVDVARMLALTGRSSRRPTRPTPAIEAIVGSRIAEIVVLGRRGPAQAAFTPPELQELGELAGADVVVDPRRARARSASAAALEADTTASSGTSRCCASSRAREPDGQAAARRAALSRLAGRDPRRASGSKAIEVVRNRLEPDGRGSVRAVADRRARDDPVRRSSSAASATAASRCRACRSTRRAARSERRRPRARRGRRRCRGVYCAGWIKRGPTRRDRHEQEGRDRDGRAAARGRAAAGRRSAGCRGATRLDGRRRRAALGGSAAVARASTLRRAGRPIDDCSSAEAARRATHRPPAGVQARRACGRSSWRCRRGRQRRRGVGERSDSDFVRRRPSSSERAVGRRDDEGGRRTSPSRASRSRAPVARWLGRIKAAAARVNAELGLLDADKAERIAAAGDRIARGELDDQFPIDVFQTGSGTSSNMNANEVIAALAGEDVHANDDVNMGQSSNDVFPSAVHLAALDEIVERPAAGARRSSPPRSRRRRREFDDVVKSGRTHWMDAVPVTLGQEFGGYAAQVRQGDRARRGRAAAARPDPARRHRRRHRPQHAPGVRRARPRAALGGHRADDLARPPTRSRRRPPATGSSRRPAR